MLGADALDTTDMNNPNGKLLLTAGAALGPGLGVWHLFSRGPAEETVSGVRPPVTADQPRLPDAVLPPAQPLASIPDPKSTVRTKMIDGGRIHTNGRPLEEVVIQYWAERYGFEVTNEELARLQATYEAVIRARRQLEDRLVQVEKLEPWRHRVIIPAHPEEGQRLRRQFVEELGATLGAARAREFLAGIESSLDRDNFGWGMVDQVLDVERRRYGQVDFMEIAHGFGLSFPGSVDGITAVNGSSLRPDDLDIYTHLARHFPKQPRGQ